MSDTAPGIPREGHKSSALPGRHELVRSLSAMAVSINAMR